MKVGTGSNGTACGPQRPAFISLLSAPAKRCPSKLSEGEAEKTRRRIKSAALLHLSSDAHHCSLPAAAIKMDEVATRDPSQPNHKLEWRWWRACWDGDRRAACLSVSYRCVYSPPFSIWSLQQTDISTKSAAALWRKRSKCCTGWLYKLCSNHRGCMMSFRGVSLKISNANKVNLHNLNARNEMNLCWSSNVGVKSHHLGYFSCNEPQ